MPQALDSSTPQPPTDGQDSVQEVVGGFPRHLTRQLIDEDGTQQSWRGGAAGWLLGAGLAALALASPEEALLGRGPGLLVAWSNESSSAGGLAARWLVELASSLSGMRLEPAAFLVSALLYGACLPILLGFGRSIGVSTGNALVIALVLLLTPAAWLAGTTPGPETLGMLGCFALFRSLWAGRVAGYTPVRMGLALFWLAVLCGTSLLFISLIPALILAPYWRSADPEPGREATPTRRNAIFAVLAIGVALGAWWVDGRAGSAGPATLLSMTESLSQVARALCCLPALALGLLGLVALMLERRNESEQRPPLWLAIWAVAPIAGIFFIDGAREIPVYQLLPLAALGGFDLLQRRADDLEAWMFPTALMAALALLIGALVWIDRQDPLADWRTRARLVLEADDLVLSSDPQHIYLLRQRWRLEALDWSATEEGDALLSETRLRLAGTARRLVLDAPEAKPTTATSWWLRFGDLEPTP